MPQKDSINKSIWAAIPVLKDLDHSGRMSFYPVALDSCLQGMVSGRP